MSEPVQINPEALYDNRFLLEVLRFSQAVVSEGRRTGALKFTRKGNRVLYRGAWLLAWLGSCQSQTNLVDEGAEQ